ncbi:MAG: hypothetical protein FD170_1414 [Bacteroidetes bacterium]|nr:MAG: hypothetical protein FD170_1414 [Bacteroidota bacterium]
MKQFTLNTDVTLSLPAAQSGRRSRSALKFLSIDNSVVNPNNIVKYWSFLSFDSPRRTTNDRFEYNQMLIKVKTNLNQS